MITPKIELSDLEQILDKEISGKIDYQLTLDLVRHGHTLYREGFDPYYYPFNEKEPLNSQRLDLTDKGIDQICNSSKDLIKRIIPGNESIIFLTSPAYRAHSTYLIMKEEFEKNGIPNMRGGYILDNLKSFSLNDTSKEALLQHFELYKIIKEKVPSASVYEYKRMIAEKMGLLIKEVYTESFEEMLDRCHKLKETIQKRALRKTSPSGYRIRVIAAAHEETLINFLDPTKQYELPNGTILEESY